jgi:leader peptidase (prepilin peptidase) / N-methyltransferase
LVGVVVPISVYLVFVGLMLGSFINLAADRVPRGESLVRPRSHCRACGRTLNTLDLLPVVGYVVRGGRCATCRTPIGVASPAVEATCGCPMLAAVVFQGLWPGALVGLALVCAFGGVLVLDGVRRRAGVAVMR